MRGITPSVAHFERVARVEACAILDSACYQVDCSRPFLAIRALEIQSRAMHHLLYPNETVRRFEAQFPSIPESGFAL